MHPQVAQQRQGIAAICQRHQVRRLDVFGSAARATDFDPERSDVDFLVEFSPQANVGLNEYFAVKDALERLLGRSVDLVESGALRNPFLLADIQQSREPVYAP